MKAAFVCLMVFAVFLASAECQKVLKKSDYIAKMLGKKTAKSIEKKSVGCTNECSYAGDGDCDDGGAGSWTSVCAYGTDCTDCGSREACVNTCAYANDGDCDDGGAGAYTSVCEWGTDCSDCGTRYARSYNKKDAMISLQGKEKA